MKDAASPARKKKNASPHLDPTSGQVAQRASLRIAQQARLDERAEVGSLVDQGRPVLDAIEDRRLVGEAH